MQKKKCTVKHTTVFEFLLITDKIKITLLIKTLLINELIKLI